jgi:3-dehydroquinate dehydratase/shikimate dehydrogenase
MSVPMTQKSSESRAQVCVSLCATSIDQLKNEIDRTKSYADLIELRLDCLPDSELIYAVGSGLLRTISSPVILTLRSTEQGGHCCWSQSKRLEFWLKHFAPNSHNTHLSDIELDLAVLLLKSQRPETAAIDWSRGICSYHDFEGSPANLEAIYERMAALPARVLKIAVRAHQITDTVPVFKLLERARREGRELIAIAMGEAGLVTRILGPARGALLTFGASDPSRATAPGQITCKELTRTYRLRCISLSTQIMGVVGAPVTQSISPQIHNAAFEALGIDAVYLPFEVTNLEEFIRRMIRPSTRELDWRLRGLSITAPHKTRILEVLDWVDDAAREIGSVNTIVVHDNLLCGYNTDAQAAVAPLRGMNLRGAHVAVIGTGGAARALLWSLRKEKAVVTVFSRSLPGATSLAEEFGAHAQPLPKASFDGFELVINAMPLGMRGPLIDETPATADQLRGAKTAYDLVYHPADTRFLGEARAAGCQIIGGLAMFLAQAAEQFRLWTGREAPLQVMTQAAALALKDRHLAFTATSSK